MSHEFRPGEVNGIEGMRHPLSINKTSGREPRFGLAPSTELPTFELVDLGAGETLRTRETRMTPELTLVNHDESRPTSPLNPRSLHQNAHRATHNQLQRNVDKSSLHPVVKFFAKTIIGFGLGASEVFPIFGGYSLGDIVSAGEAAVGKTIYGQKLGVGERLAIFILAAIPLVPSRPFAEVYYRLKAGNKPLAH